MFETSTFIPIRFRKCDLLMTRRGAWIGSWIYWTPVTTGNYNSCKGLNTQQITVLQPSMSPLFSRRVTAPNNGYCILCLPACDCLTTNSSLRPSTVVNSSTVESRKILLVLVSTVFFGFEPSREP